MMHANKLDVDLAMLLVIDLQTSLLPLIDRAEAVATSAGQLIRGAGLFGLPTLVTEQYPKGIGGTHGYVRSALESVKQDTMHKMHFSVCGDDGAMDALRRIDRPQIIVCGIETHVCVQQTTLDLVAMDHRVFLCADAVGSRRALDHETALARMRSAGAVVTTVEAVLFELCDRCDTDRFKALLKLIKDPTGGQDVPRFD